MHPASSALFFMTLTRIVTWSHFLAREILRPGDLAVDLTAGKGRDTCLLAEMVAPAGRVVAFDVQEPALAATDQALRETGHQPVRLQAGQQVPESFGIFLVQSCHSNLCRVVPAGAKVIMANLGYLPGGDPTVMTAEPTTLAALEQSLEILAAGGRLIVTVYPGHAGGREEDAAVSRFFSRLSSSDWQVLQMRVANHAGAPGLIAAEKKL